MNNNFYDYEGYDDDNGQEYIDELVGQLINRTLSNYDDILTRFYVNSNVRNVPRNNIVNNFTVGVFDMMYDLTSSINTRDDDLERVLRESFQNQTSSIERTNIYINFPSQKYNTVDCNKYDKTCSICLCDYEKDNMVSTTICHHLFHTDCITEWSRYKKDCPVCRTELNNEKKE